MVRTRVLALLVPIASLAVIVGQSVPASATAATITLSPSFAPPNASVTVAGKGFGASESIVVMLDASQVASAQTGPLGGFTATFTVPKGTKPGSHEITAKGERSGIAAHLRLAVQTEWAKFHSDLANTGYNRAENVLRLSKVAKLQEQWSFPTGNTVISAPAVYRGVVYVGSDDDNVYAITASTGVPRWSFHTGGPIFSSPAVTANGIFIGSADGNVYGLTLSGAKLWSYNTGYRVDSSPAVSAGIVYVGASGGVYALRASTGSVVWNFRPAGFTTSTPAVVGNIVYVSSLFGGVYALNAATGKTIWHFDAGCCLWSSPVIAGGLLYVGSTDQNVYAINAATGAVVWTYATQDQIHSTAAVAGKMVYIGSDDGNLYALHALTGKLKWSFVTGGFVDSSPAVARGVVYVGSEDGSIYALRSSTGSKLWSQANGSPIESSPAIASGEVFVGTDAPNARVIAYGTRLITSVVFTGTTPAPTITVNGRGFGSSPPTGYPADVTSCGRYSNNGDWFGTDGLIFTDVGKGWDAGRGVPGDASCIGLIVVSWTPTQVVFQFGDAYDSFSDWFINNGDSFTVTLKGVDFSSLAYFS